MKRIGGGEVLNPGELRHQIVWQEKHVTGQDAFGQDVFALRTVVTSRCQVNELQGRELQDAMQRWAEARFEIKQHFSQGIKQAHRGLWFVNGENRILDIVAVVDPIGLRRYQVIYAKEWAE